jgi:hypothetical protein
VDRHRDHLQRRHDAAQMIFGPRGRYSTDLDFIRRSDISDEGIMEMMLDALSQPYHDLSFRFDRDKDWYFTDKSLTANPVCVHAGRCPYRFPRGRFRSTPVRDPSQAVASTIAAWESNSGAVSLRAAT